MSLFPFLAVLLCTMGALIVLLVILVQQARVSASQVSARRAPARGEELGATQEDLHQEYQTCVWRQEVLERQRGELTRRLADRRLQLSHLEDHIRRLQAEWKQLQQQASQLESVGAAQSVDVAAATSEAAQLQDAIRVAQEEYEQAKQRLAQRPRSFAVIPYDGPNSTRRRPIYIECTEAGIVIQPEGLVLKAEDFQGPLGPGNPLDAALRTIREHLARTGQTGAGGEPYPLLLVRPDGTVAYNVARAAMKSWEDEFGYELIEDGVELKFPPPDAALREELARTVRDARQRQSMLAAAMPSQFRGEGLTGFVASPTRGGFVPLGSFGEEGPPRGRTGSRSAPAPPSRPRPQPGNPAPAGNRAGLPPGSDSGSPGPPASGGCAAAGAAAGLAQVRGGNWALPKANARATGITRPIQVSCLQDQLILQPDRGNTNGPRVVPVPGTLAETIDEFVSAVWEHMEHWGLAVAGGYWKPVLHVDVAKGAEFRFQELQALLAGSGIEVERKQR